MTTRVLTIDLDNTLWETPSVIIKAEEALYQWLHNHCPDVTEQYSREQLCLTRQHYATHHSTIAHKLSTLRKNFLVYIISRCGYANADQKASLAFNVFYNARQNVTLFEGALTALKKLNNDYRLIAITNGNADLSIINIDQYFEKYPLIVKPIVGCRSIGVSVANEEKELKHRLSNENGLLAQELIGTDDSE